MASQLVPTSSPIVLFFKWEGPCSSHNMQRDVGVVDLIFKNTKDQVSVSIPEKGSSHQKQFLPFTLRSIHPVHPLLNKERSSEALQLTIEQIKNLTLKAGIVEQSSKKGPATLDANGKVIHQIFFERYDLEMEIEFPETLEEGQSYCLTVNSEENDLTAKLTLKEGPLKREATEEKRNENAPLTEKQKELIWGFSGMLGGLVASRLEEIPELRGGDPYQFQLVDQCTQNEFQKLAGKDVLKEIVELGESIEACEKRQSYQEGYKVQMLFLETCLRAIGANGLGNVMRSTLVTLFKERSVPVDDSRIAEISEEFKKIYDQQLEKLRKQMR